MAGRGRPSGSKNKSTYCMVPLGELMAVLQPNAKIPVKREFADTLLSLVNASTEDDNEVEFEEKSWEDDTSVAETAKESVISIVRHSPKSD